jgi:hypothetical protein
MGGVEGLFNHPLALLHFFQSFLRSICRIVAAFVPDDFHTSIGTWLRFDGCAVTDRIDHQVIFSGGKTRRDQRER